MCRRAAGGHDIPRISAADRVSRCHHLRGVQLRAWSACRMRVVPGMPAGEPLPVQPALESRHRGYREASCLSMGIYARVGGRGGLLGERGYLSGIEKDSLQQIPSQQGKFGKAARYRTLPNKRMVSPRIARVTDK